MSGSIDYSRQARLALAAWREGAPAKATAAPTGATAPH